MKWSNDTALRRLTNGETAIAVIGLGYVGLPAAMCFAGKFKVIGYDINGKRIKTLKEKHGTANGNILFTDREEELDKASFHIITVPTPTDSDNKPDLAPLLDATKTVARHIKPGDCVVYESTVHPGCTEDTCVPIIERYSGLEQGKDFKTGYSPERINPNDKRHQFSNTPKIVSGNDADALELISNIYSSVIDSQVHRAPCIKVAEASKMLENAQRNVNIALMNEMSVLFSRTGIEMRDVLEAAATKWNFARYTPGLVGGHCIPVDPHYLLAFADKAGVETPVLRTCCGVNDNMARYVAESLIGLIRTTGRNPEEARALIMGFTYKENVGDIRNTLTAEIFNILTKAGIATDITDPHADPKEVSAMYGITLAAEPTGKYDIIAITVAHDEYKALDEDYFIGLSDGNAVLADIKWIYKDKIKSLRYWSL